MSLADRYRDRLGKLPPPEPHPDDHCDLVEELLMNDDECADYTCRHDRVEHSVHTGRCQGEYETRDGTVYPCDCMDFREKR